LMVRREIHKYTTMFSKQCFSLVRIIKKHWKIVKKKQSHRATMGWTKLDKVVKTAVIRQCSIHGDIM
jgi:hypothetical protein